MPLLSGQIFGLETDAHPCYPSKFSPFLPDVFLSVSRHLKKWGFRVPCFLYVVSMDFQGISSAEYSDEYIFTKAFMRMFEEAPVENALGTEIETAVQHLDCRKQTTIGGMFYFLSEICKISSKPIILMIDEVESDRIRIKIFCQKSQYTMDGFRQSV